MNKLSNFDARGVLRLAEKKIQPVKSGGDWVYGLWENVEYVFADKGRKHHNNAMLISLNIEGNCKRKMPAEGCGLALFL